MPARWLLELLEVGGVRRDAGARRHITCLKHMPVSKPLLTPPGGLLCHPNRRKKANALHLLPTVPEALRPAWFEQATSR